MPYAILSIYNHQDKRPDTLLYTTDTHTALGVRIPQQYTHQDTARRKCGGRHLIRGLLRAVGMLKQKHGRGSGGTEHMRIRYRTKQRCLSHWRLFHLVSLMSRLSGSIKQTGWNRRYITQTSTRESTRRII